MEKNQSLPPKKKWSSNIRDGWYHITLNTVEIHYFGVFFLRLELPIKTMVIGVHVCVFSYFHIYIYMKVYIYIYIYICITNTCIVPLPPFLQAAKFLTGRALIVSFNKQLPRSSWHAAAPRSMEGVIGWGFQGVFSPRIWSSKKFRYLILELLGLKPPTSFLTYWTSKWRCLVQDDITFSKRWSSSSMLSFGGWTFVGNLTWIPGRDIWKPYFLSTEH